MRIIYEKEVAYRACVIFERHILVKINENLGN